MAASYADRLAAGCRSWSRRLVYLLLALMAFAPHWVVVYHHVGPVPSEFSSILFHLVDLPLLLAIGLWLASHVLDSSRPLRFDPWFITLPLLSLTLLAGVNAFWAVSPALAWDRFLRLALLLVFFLLIRNEITDSQQAAWALTIGVILHAPLAVGQFIWQSQLEKLWLGDMGIMPTEPWLRGYGLTPHPNILGGYLLLGLVAITTISLTQLKISSSRRLQYGLLLIFGLGIAGLLSSFSRSAWLGTVMAGALLLLVQGAKGLGSWDVLRRLALVGGLVSLIYISIWPGYFAARLVDPLAARFGIASSAPEEIELINLTTRADYVSVANQLIRAHFPWGVGGGNFSVAAYLANPDTPANYLHQPVHQILLLVAAELGLFGGLSWLFLWAAFGAASWRSRSRLQRDPWLLAWSMALLGLFVTSFFDFYLWGWQVGRLMLWAVLGLWAGRYSQEPEPNQNYGAARLKVPNSSVSIDT